MTRGPCRELVAVARGRSCHVVGGAVRDRLLGRPHHDLDLLVDGDGERIAGELADRLPGRLVDLGGDAFGSWRIVRAAGDVDLWDRDGAPLRRELARRDLTVNALAVELPSGELRDPLRGLEDLRAGILRCPRRDTLRDDPLRVLRLVRLASELAGFAPTAATVLAARQAAPEIERIAGERVREEWSRLQDTEDPSAMVALLCDLDLYPRLWVPEGEPVDGDLKAVPGAAPEAARTAKLTVGRLRDGAEELEHALPPSAPVADPRVALDLLLLAALPRPAAAVAGLARRRHRSQAEATRLRRLLSWPRPPGCDAACRRFLHQLAADASTGLLWLGARALAAHRRRPWAHSVTQIAELEVAYGEEIRTPPTLLTGDALAASTGLSGRALGRALDAIREAQVLGTVRSPAAALRLVRRLAELGIWRDADSGDVATAVSRAPRHKN